MTNYASPEDIESATGSWSDGQVNCRIYGHSWRGLSAVHRPGSFTLFQRCGRCRSERQQEIDERGYPLTPWKTRYVEGYLLRKLGRVGHDGRAVLRLASIRRSYLIEEADDLSA